MTTLLQDLRYGLRNFRKNLGFTMTAVAALALGIGATTAIFSVINTVLLQPLPYPEASRIVALGLSSPQGTGYGLAVTEFVAMEQATKTLESFSAYDFGGPGINLTGDHPEQLQGIHVSAGYFKVFGASIALGRAFSADEDRPHGAHVVVVSNGLWQSHFGGDPNLVGKAMPLGGEPYTIVGVLARSFISDPPAVPVAAASSRSEQHRPGALPGRRGTSEIRSHGKIRREPS